MSRSPFSARDVLGRDVPGGSILLRSNWVVVDAVAKVVSEAILRWPSSLAPTSCATLAWMPRWFNTAGPNNPNDHYTLPVLARLPEVWRLIDTKSWFVLHAPRQSGKTTAMEALAADLTATGTYAAVLASCEVAASCGTSAAEASQSIIADIRRNATLALPEALRPPLEEPVTSPTMLATFVDGWCRACPLPVVLLLDEIDALRGEALLSILRQLRSIYRARPKAAPHTVALIGLRDVRDYRGADGDNSRLGTSSPFNISVKSLTLRSFTRAEVATLYGQHAAESGQVVTDLAVERAWHYTQGQPWLVNAIARQVVEEMGVVGPIDASHMDVAKEQLIVARATHLDSLAHRLEENRVRAVIEPMLTGVPSQTRPTMADLDYVTDLGLIVQRQNEERQIANPIYREILPRELAEPILADLPRLSRNRWSLPDGHLDLQGLLDAFIDFWRQHGEWMMRGQAWPEAAHQIVLMAFLQRVVNGGGSIEREYGLGTKRLDLLVRWFIRRDAYGIPLEEDRHAIEVKVWRAGDGDPLGEGLAQLDTYCDRLALSLGTLIIFDARPAATTSPWASRGTLSEHRTPGGRTVRLLRA